MDIITYNMRETHTLCLKTRFHNRTCRNFTSLSVDTYESFSDGIMTAVDFVRIRRTTKFFILLCSREMVEKFWHPPLPLDRFCAGTLVSTCVPN